MADIVDIAAENDFSSERLNEMRAAKPVAIARGSCLYCDTKLEPIRLDPKGPLMDRLYCDADCRNDYEAEQKTLSKQRRT